MMQGGDISDDIPIVLWVVEDLVLEVTQSLVLGDVPKPRWGHKVEPPAASDSVVLDKVMMSRLWKFKTEYAQAIKMELLHFGDKQSHSEQIMGLLDTAPNPFSAVLVAPDFRGVQALLPYRPDVLSVIDNEDGVWRWGGKGRLMMDML
jgi:hypothetical protein